VPGRVVASARPGRLPRSGGCRVANQARLRELWREHGDEVQMFSAHDPWAFERYRSGADTKAA
jgi:hypothetical protein